MEQFPEEVSKISLSYLPVIDLLRLKGEDRDVAKMLASPKFWPERLLEDFGISSNEGEQKKGEQEEELEDFTTFFEEEEEEEKKEKKEKKEEKKEEEEEEEEEYDEGRETYLRILIQDLDEKNDQVEIGKFACYINVDFEHDLPAYEKDNLIFAKVIIGMLIEGCKQKVKEELQKRYGKESDSVINKYLFLSALEKRDLSDMKKIAYFLEPESPEYESPYLIIKKEFGSIPIFSPEMIDYLIEMKLAPIDEIYEDVFDLIGHSEHALELLKYLVTHYKTSVDYVSLIKGYSSGAKRRHDIFARHLYDNARYIFEESPLYQAIIKEKGGKLSYIDPEEEQDEEEQEEAE